MTSRLVLLALAIAGCASLSPSGARVRRTYDLSVRQKCTPLGTVDSRPPYLSPEDLDIQFRNKAASRGADTIFEDPSSMRHVSAEAYACRGVRLGDTP